MTRTIVECWSPNEIKRSVSRRNICIVSIPILFTHRSGQQQCLFYDHNTGPFGHGIPQCEYNVLFGERSLSTRWPISSQETNADDQHGQMSLSAAHCKSCFFAKTSGCYSWIGRTTTDASSAVHRMIDTIVERQPQIIRLDSITPTMVSTGTMTVVPTQTACSLADHEIIDLCSSTRSTIESVTPGTEIIDLCTPNTPTI